MTPYLLLWCRAFAIVFLTAANVRLISRGLYPWAFVTGWGISFVWWHNSRTAARSDLPMSSLVYATGAATGTVCGMWLGGLL